MEYNGKAGIIMSGGLDSAVVAAAAAAERVGHTSPRSYSAVFPDQPAIDESPRIELLADHLDLPGVQLEILGRGVFALSLEYLRQWDIPLTGPGFMLEYPLVARAAADGVTTLLDGQGGNEIFDFSPYLAADRLRRGRIVSSWRLVRDFPLGLDSAPWKQSFGLWRRFALKGAVPYRLQRAVRLHRGPARYVPGYLSTESAQSFFEGEDPLAWKRNAQAPLWWAWKAYITTRIWEEARLPEYLRHRAAMGGIEARPPLMDTRLIELALSVPPELNFDSLHDRPIMREGLRARVPDTVRLWREKSNLAPLYYAAVLEDIPGVRRILVSRGAEVRAFVRPDAVEALLEKPPPPGGRGYLDWMASIWSLVVVECWLRQQGDPGFAERTLESGLFRTPSSRTIRDRS
jgi:asparagine synthase (glutamine-hydrolysing)